MRHCDVENSDVEPLLSTAEVDAVRGILDASGRRGEEITRVSVVWGERRHLLRVTTSTGTVIVKRPKFFDDETRDVATFHDEVAVVSFLDAMPTPVAPRMMGFDAATDILVMEDLPPGLALSDLFLLGSAAEATAGVQAVVRALASVHAWSFSREADFVKRYSLSPMEDRSWTPWNVRALSAREEFVACLTTWGVDVGGLNDEIDRALEILSSPHHRGVIHGDLCPDNVRVANGAARIFDFEAALYGHWALDVAYFLSPFPSCWCFAELPTSVSAAALVTYEEEMLRWGITLDDSWNESLAAALLCFVLVRVATSSAIEGPDDEWGTTSLRTRIVTWLRCFERFAPCEETFPAAIRVARELLASPRLTSWDVSAPAYPAFAAGDVDVVKVPEFFEPGL